MNQEETVALYKQGMNAWNAWASDMLAKRATMEKADIWNATSVLDLVSGRSMLRSGNAETAAWIEAARADFSCLIFSHKSVPASEIRNNEPPYVIINTDQNNFNLMCFPGEVSFAESQFYGNALFKNSQFNGDANFQNTLFNGHARFEHAQFMRSAWFHGAQFAREAWFLHAHFFKYAKFHDAKFGGGTLFENTIFTGEAWFHRSNFAGIRTSFIGAFFHSATNFEGAQFTTKTLFYRSQFLGISAFKRAHFSSDSMFNEAVFAKYTTFAYATFKGLHTSFEKVQFSDQADFRAISVERAFDLGDTYFTQAPNFIQAHFAEAPRLDNCKFEYDVWRLGLLRVILLVRQRRLKLLIRLCKRECELRLQPLIVIIKRSTRDAQLNDSDARFRALRRLAIQGHDHENERKFLQEEIRARRFVQDKPWHAAFLFGLAYGAFSDFGGSIGRPLLWGAALIGIFTVVYYYLALPGTCGGELGETWAKAWYLSLKNSIILISWDTDTGIKKVTDCLNEAKDTSIGRALALGVAQITQKSCSAALLFLFALAIRNRFKIK